jgi:hypothetical protein
VSLRPVAKPCVFLAAARHHGHEATAAGRDVAHRLARAQLGVGDVDEVGVTAAQRNQPVPGGHVRLVVGRVAGRGAVGERYRAIGRHGQDPHQLLEVGAVVLVVAEGDLGRWLAAARAAVGVRVGAAEGDRGRVVVQLAQVELELGDDAEHKLGQQRCAVGVKQPLERAPDAVVVERCDLRPREPEQGRLKPRRPLAQAVERLPLQAQVGDHHADRACRRDAQARVAVGQVALEQRADAHASKEASDDRQPVERSRAKLERSPRLADRLAHHRLATPRPSESRCTIGQNDDANTSMPDDPSPPERRRRELIAQIAQIGFILPGTLNVAPNRCGKPRCACHANPPRLHGPYITWTRKVAGKTVTRRLTAEQAERYRRWFDDNRKLRQLISELEALSLSTADEAERWGTK